MNENQNRIPTPAEIAKHERQMRHQAKWSMTSQLLTQAASTDTGVDAMVEGTDAHARAFVYRLSKVAEEFITLVKEDEIRMEENAPMILVRDTKIVRPS